MVNKSAIIAAAAATAMVLLAGMPAIPSYAAGESDNIVTLYQGWDRKLQTHAAKVSDEYDIDQSLVLAVIYNESRFQSGLTHKNTNGSTDYGLMQVNDVNYEFLHEHLAINSMTELLDDETGIECGVYLLAYHKSATNSDSQALLRYQVGEGNYSRMKSAGQTTNATHTRVLGYREAIAGYLGDTKTTTQLMPVMPYQAPYKTIMNSCHNILTE